MASVLEDGQRVTAARISLTRQIDHGGVVLSSRLAEAFLNVPRHPFVPVFYRREGSRFLPWSVTDGDAEAWLDAVYSDDSLITEVDGVHAEQAPPGGVEGVPTSSSTAPGLMADMLDALDVHQGHEVLEIGTGTGYNAALLCRLAGDAHVTTIDNDPFLTSAAQARLSEQGFHPLVSTGDGARDIPADARYDRIIATASVRHLPPSWLEHCRTGGLLVVPIKGTLAGGMIARLTKLPDGTAAGRILHTPAAFMPLRSRAGTEQRIPVLPAGGHRASRLSARALDDWTFSFFAELHMPPGLLRTYSRENGLHTTTLYDPADGSAARIAERHEGSPVVTTAGPRDLWAPIEAAHDQWNRLNRPRREWFTIRAGPTGQALTYEAPDGTVHRWALE